MRPSSKDVRETIRSTLSPRLFAFYLSVLSLTSLVSLLIPYRTQVNLSIMAGLCVAVLLMLSMVFVRGSSLLDAVFIAGILLLFVALFSSDLPVRAVLENVRHISLVMSVILTGLYLASQRLLKERSGTQLASFGSLGKFFSVCSTTLASELCSCLHPSLVLQTVGVPLFIKDQVTTGFMLMMTTLANQVRLTYRMCKFRQQRLCLPGRDITEETA